VLPFYGKQSLPRLPTLYPLATIVRQSSIRRQNITYIPCTCVSSLKASRASRLTRLNSLLFGALLKPYLKYFSGWNRVGVACLMALQACAGLKDFHSRSGQSVRRDVIDTSIFIYQSSRSLQSFNLNSSSNLLIKHRPETALQKRSSRFHDGAKSRPTTISKINKNFHHGSGPLIAKIK